MISSDGFSRIFEDVKSRYPDKALIFTYCHGTDTGTETGYLTVKIPEKVTPGIMRGTEECKSRFFVTIQNHEDMTVDDARTEIIQKLDKQFTRMEKRRERRCRR